MKNIDDDDRVKRKWWSNPMAPYDLPELRDSDRQRAKSFNHWLLVWGVMLFGVFLGMKPLPGGLEATPAWRFLLVFSPIVATIFLIRAFLRFFHETKDELIRKIHYDSLAIGFAVAFFLGICFGLSAVIVGPSAIAGPFTWGAMFLAYIISYSRMYSNHDV